MIGRNRAPVEDSQHFALLERVNPRCDAEQGAKRPEERSKGILRATFSWMPTAVSTAVQLSTLCDKYVPVIKAHLGF